MYCFDYVVSPMSLALRSSITGTGVMAGVTEVVGVTGVWVTGDVDGDFSSNTGVPSSAFLAASTS